LQRRQRAAFIPTHQPRVARDIGRDDGGKAALFRNHRSASAELGSSRPAAIRRNVCTRMRCSNTRRGKLPAILSLQYSGAIAFPAQKTDFAFSISPAPTWQTAKLACAEAIRGMSRIARDAHSTPPAYCLAQ